jgi:hypothetical protein
MLSLESGHTRVSGSRARGRGMRMCRVRDGDLTSLGCAVPIVRVRPGSGQGTDRWDVTVVTVVTCDLAW